MARGDALKKVPGDADSSQECAAQRASIWDLDHTLVSTDTFIEQCVRLTLRKPWLIPRAALWLMRGKGYCKGRVAEVIATPAVEWPFRPEALRHIARERAEGRPIVLATAAHHRVANAIAEHLDCFDEILASSDSINLKGVNKRDAIARLVEKARWSGFSYVGDSEADLPVWRAADEIVVVKPSAALEARVRSMGKPVHVLGERQSVVRPMWRACRPHQWAKNVLLFLPMLLGHKVDVSTLMSVAIAFVTFSLCASAVYVLNDLGDVGADRSHPSKCKRPFASGSLSPLQGVVLAICLLVASFVMAAFFLPPMFRVLLLVYVAANVGYSIWWKQVPVLDVMVLACMYALRLEIGGVAAGVILSEWLLTFSLFFFTSLAFAKRYVELVRVAKLGDAAMGRGYSSLDTDLLLVFGIASGYVAVLVLALYMNSDQMRSLYGSSRTMWFLCPLVMYWVTRVWLLARRGEIDDDPVVFALTDRTSVCTAAMCVALGALSSYIFMAGR
jgi:4-hydroxybenzoate polyprenyltransferase/phosphoserine phosphatase